MTNLKFSIIAVGTFCCAGQSHALEIYGTVDAAVTYTSASGNGHVTALNPDGGVSNRLGFKGAEDLGAGLKADFVLEAGFRPDNGLGVATSTNNVDAGTAGGLLFNRRSTVGLAGQLGEIRLGRDYTPTFTSLSTSMHPIGTVGVGNSGQLFYPVQAAGTTPRTNVRASNAVNYFLPAAFGGLYGNFMYALGEQPSNAVGGTKKDGTYRGGRIGYASGPLNLAAATARTSYSTADYTQSNFGINYQLGSVKLMYLWGQNKIGPTKTTVQLVGTRWTMGASELRAAYTALKAEKVANDATQIALQYVYGLSKRTSLYASHSKVRNKGQGTAFAVGTGNAVKTPGGSSSGVDFGISHSF